MFINWLELGENGAITTGNHISISDNSSHEETGSSTLPQPIYGAALMPPIDLNVMQTEINRLYISTKDGSIIPISVAVPRRQYIGFHSDLFPPVFDLGQSL